MNIIIRLKLIKQAIYHHYLFQAIILSLFFGFIKIKGNIVFVKANKFNPLLWITVFIGSFIFFIIEIYRYCKLIIKDNFNFKDYTLDWREDSRFTYLLNKIKNNRNNK